MTPRSGWAVAIFAVTAVLGIGLEARAGVVTFFSDRADWIAAATSAGLMVTTEDFSTAPPAYPDITVAGVDFSTGIRAGVPFDAVNQRIGFTSGGGRTLSLDYTGGSSLLFGFGVDMGPTIGLLRTTDVDGTDIAAGVGGPAGHFVGLLGTAPFDPANPFPSNSAVSGSDELSTSGLAGSVYFDNLSVATGVTAAPEPSAPALLGLFLIGLMGLSLDRRRR